ncbi:MAG: hypothetical protein HOI06_00765, partial [Pelagibacteraceae bacterium]|nr:hypothetical protein [Pelagibacteraceae bacterium]
MRENIIKPLSGNFYKETKNKLLNLIEEKNLDGFLVTNPANIFYFTGFFYVTNERPSGFYLSKNNISKLFIPLLEKENAENLQVNEIHIYEEFPGETNPYTFMANTISKKKIGTDIKNTDILNLIKNNFEELNHKTGIEMFRYVKLDEEINLIIEATKYADLALEYLKECAKEMINKNVSERELVQIC